MLYKKNTTSCSQHSLVGDSSDQMVCGTFLNKHTNDVTVNVFQDCAKTPTLYREATGEEEKLN